MNNPLLFFVDFPTHTLLKQHGTGFSYIPEKMTMRSFTYVLVVIIICSVFSSCAAMGHMIRPGVWLGLLNLAAAAAITVYIFRGSAK